MVLFFLFFTVLYFFFFIGISLTYQVVLISGKQQNKLVMHIYIYRQGPTVEHREIYQIPCNNLFGKGI